MISNELKNKILAINCEEVVSYLTDFIRTQVLKRGFSRVVLGLSGGIDSSLSAFLAVKSLGAENVIGLIIPYETSAPSSRQDAELLMEKLHLDHRLVDITPMIKPYFQKKQEMDTIRRGNVMARMRMIVLYDISAADRALVMGTGNKTEYLLGYTTLWGDSACAINPLGDLYKSQVRALARFVGLPEVIINKKPSADLWVGQTDEEELGVTYEEADIILALLFNHRVPPRKVIEMGFPAELVSKIRLMVQRSKYKRHLPVIARLSSRNSSSSVSPERGELLSTLTTG